MLRGESSFGWKFTSTGENASSALGNPLDAEDNGDAKAGITTAGAAAIKGAPDSPTVGGILPSSSSPSLFDAGPSSAVFLANGERGKGGGDAAAAADSMPGMSKGAACFFVL